MTEEGRHVHRFVAVCPSWIQMEPIIHIRRKSWVPGSWNGPDPLPIKIPIRYFIERWSWLKNASNHIPAAFVNVVEVEEAMFLIIRLISSVPLISTLRTNWIHTLMKMEITQVTNISKTELCSDKVRVPSFVSPLWQQFVTVGWHRWIFDPSSTRNLSNLASKRAATVANEIDWGNLFESAHHQRTFYQHVVEPFRPGLPTFRRLKIEKAFYWTYRWNHFDKTFCLASSALRKREIEKASIEIRQRDWIYGIDSKISYFR